MINVKKENADLDLFQHLLFNWSVASISVNSKAESSSVEKLEKKMMKKLPQEFLNYLSVSNGMTDGECDNNLICFWSIERMKTELCMKTIENSSESFISFGERNLFDLYFLIEVTNNRQNTGRVLIESVDRQLIFKSFRAFVSSYVEDEMSVVNF